MKRRNLKDCRALIKIINQTVDEVGKNNEKRVVRAFNEDYPYKDRPSWIRVVRHATEKEDANQIDVVFETTNVGSIHLQVKSSRAGDDKYRLKQSLGLVNSRIISVIIKPHYVPRQIIDVVMPPITYEYRQRLKSIK